MTLIEVSVSQACASSDSVSISGWRVKKWLTQSSWVGSCRQVFTKGAGTSDNLDGSMLSLGDESGAWRTFWMAFFI